VAEAICGIHAQVMSTCDLQVWARVSPDSRGAVAAALLEDRSLVRTWCMRGTLHLLTPSQHALYAAVFDPSGQYTPVWYRAFEVTPEDMESLGRALEDALVPGEPMTRRELAEAVTARAGARLGERLRSGWGELLKPFGRRGLFVNGPARGSEITYVRTDRWLGSPLPVVDPEAARAEWLRRYLRAYGPASTQDYARWLGVRQVGPINRALAALGSEVASVRVAGRRLHCLAADVASISSSAGAADGSVCLLPGFDPYVLGHADRDHLVPEEHRAKVYRTGGWISPTVLSGGRVVGTWEHGPEPGGRLAVRVTPFTRLTAAERSGVEAEAARLAAHFAQALALYT
jgi:Winged helix DNA-binding domain